MGKDKIAYVCDNCGQESPKWIGKCPSCGKWNTFKEIRVADTRQQAATTAAATAGHQLRKNKVLRLRDRIKDAKIHTDILGSDHCPVELELL